MASSTRPQRISCQFSYIHDPPGILKIIEFLCDAIALILGAAAPAMTYNGHKGFFIFVSALAIIITTILFLLAFLNIQAFCMPRHWPMIEMIWCAFIALLYFIASIIVATIAKYNGVYGAAAFFGFAAMITYVADALYRFRLHRAGPSGRHTQTTITTTTVKTTTINQPQAHY